MDFINEEQLIPALSQLGTGIIFLYLYLKERASVKEKDVYIMEINDKLLKAFQENTKAADGLKNSLNTNTEVMKQLSQHTYNVLLRQQQIDNSSKKEYNPRSEAKRN